MRRLEIDRALVAGELEDVLMFQGLPEGELAEIAKAGEFREYAEGEAVISQGTRDPWVYVLVEGRAEVTVSVESGPEVVVGHLRAGEVFGETALFSDLPRGATVRPETVSSILALSRDRLTVFINKYPRAGLKIFGYVVYGLINKLHSSNRELVLEKECNVTDGDIESLMRLVPSTLDDILGA